MFNKAKQFIKELLITAIWMAPLFGGACYVAFVIFSKLTQGN